MKSLGKESRSSTLMKTKIFPFLATFIALFGTWIILSGKFDELHLVLGLLSCALVAYISSDLLFPEGKPQELFLSVYRFLKYIPWLLYQIWLANWHVLYLTFHPRMMDLIDPHIIRFQSKLTKDLSLVTFANSITLTPGTITVSVSVDGDFKVHAIDKVSAEPLPGEMEERVARAFGEE
ncbi:MAG TPA: protein MnhE [Desulfobacteraceae bacterium]|nr:MAG: protein MnhE [Deltaproteobacteria bacterium]HDZ23456.1 protein MnhE [Desulfobacteraceae bacterium]